MGKYRYKINTQKYVAFLYINNSKKREVKKTISFIIVSKRIKYVRINLAKEAKDMYIKS